MSPRRVLYLAWAPFFSGAERALLLTLRALDPRRYEPFVLVGTDGEFADQVLRLGIPCRIVRLRQLDRLHPVQSVRSVLEVCHWAVRHRVAIVHSNDVPSFQPGGYAAHLLGMPSVTHVRFPDKAVGYRWFLRPGFSLALFVSRALMKESVEDAPEVFGSRSEVLHDCVAPQPEWSTEEIASHRDHLGLPRDAIIVALTGQIAEVKGIWDFVEAG